MKLMKWLQGGMLTALAAPAMAQVTVEEIEYEGWANSIEIANPEVRVVVVPAIGRIMYYGFVGGENILWSDPALYGQVLPDGRPNVDAEGQYTWTNFGGDKVWPNQQSEFVEINGYAWPPDHAFDGAVHEAELLPEGVVITSPVSEYNGARSVRAIRLAERGTRVEIHQRLEKLADAKVEPLRYTIWNVTQIKQPEQTLYPLNPHSHFEQRYHPFGFAESAARDNFTIEGDLGIFVPDPVEAQKTGADSDRWLAGIVGDVVMAEFFRRDATQHYPDGGLSAEVYTCPDYTELELLSPWVYLQVGETLTHAIAWELYRLPASAQTLEERRQAAVEWLGGRGE